MNESVQLRRNIVRLTILMIPWTGVLLKVSTTFDNTEIQSLIAIYVVGVLALCSEYLLNTYLRKN